MRSGQFCGDIEIEIRGIIDDLVSELDLSRGALLNEVLLKHLIDDSFEGFLSIFEKYRKPILNCAFQLQLKFVYTRGRVKDKQFIV